MGGESYTLLLLIMGLESLTRVRLIESDVSGLAGFNNTVNYFVEALIPTNTSTVLYTSTTVLSTKFKLLSVFGWGVFDGEFLIKINGSIKGGGRTSAANRTLYLDYSAAPIVASQNDILEVYVEHFAGSSKVFRCNILGSIFNL